MKLNAIPLLVVGLLFNSWAYGANYVFEPWVSEPLAFSFSFQREIVDYPTTNGKDIHIEAMGVRTELMELTLPVMNLGMAASRQWIESFGDDGLKGDAYRFELSDALFTPRWRNMRVAARLSYLYSRYQGEDPQFELNLHGAELNTVAMLYVSDIIGLYAGGGFAAASGKMTGIRSADIPFKGSIGNFYHAGIDILLGQGGHVGLESKYREYLSMEVFFQRRY